MSIQSECVLSIYCKRLLDLISTCRLYRKYFKCLCRSDITNTAYSMLLKNRCERGEYKNYLSGKEALNLQLPTWYGMTFCDLNIQAFFMFWTCITYNRCHGNNDKKDIHSEEKQCCSASLDEQKHEM